MAEEDRELLTASHNGFKYETYACRLLKKHFLVPKSFNPDGGANKKPDIILQYKGNKTGCEMKMRENLSGGSLVITYDIDDLTHPWKFSQDENKKPEAKVIIDLVEGLELLPYIGVRWKETPRELEIRRKEREITKSGKETTEQREARYRRDLAKFSNLIGKIPPTAIEDYYISKGSHYINVGNRGFYRLGDANPFGLENVPRFADCCTGAFRLRVHKKKANFTYVYTFVLEFNMPASQKSPYNIAPINGKDPHIIESKLNIGCFI